MPPRLNKAALHHARTLVAANKVNRSEGDWSETAPTADDENAFIKSDGYAEYAKWHLGIDTDHPADTKARYSFPYGDFSKVRRAGVIAIESRAAQNDHDEIATAAMSLLELIDKD